MGISRMVSPNEQMVVNGRRVLVQLVQEKAEAFVTVGSPITPNAPPERVSIQPFLDGGLDERAALKAVLALVAAGVRGATA